MKKLVLSLGFFGLMASSQAQTIFSIEAPASISGGYDFNLSSNGWAFPDKSISSNAVIDTLALGLDGNYIRFVRM